MMKTQHIEIDGVKVMLCSERERLNQHEKRLVTKWSVFHDGKTIARAFKKPVVIERARKALGATP